MEILMDDREGAAEIGAGGQKAVFARSDREADARPRIQAYGGLFARRGHPVAVVSTGQ